MKKLFVVTAFRLIGTVAMDPKIPFENDILTRSVSVDLVETPLLPFQLSQIFNGMPSRTSVC